MTNVLNFIRWALTHVNLDTVPSGAVLANGTVHASTTPLTHQGEVGSKEYIAPIILDRLL